MYFTEPGFVLLAVESESTGGNGEGNMGDAATVNCENILLVYLNLSGTSYAK